MEDGIQKKKDAGGIQKGKEIMRDDQGQKEEDGSYKTKITKTKAEYKKYNKKEKGNDRKVHKDTRKFQKIGREHRNTQIIRYFIYIVYKIEDKKSRFTLSSH